MAGYELIKEFYRWNPETNRDEYFVSICGIVDNESDRDAWLAKMQPLNTYSEHYGYNTIKEF